MMAMDERRELTSAMTEPSAVCRRLHALCVYMQPLCVCVSAMTVSDAEDTPLDL